MFPKKLVAGEGGADDAGQWMANIGCANPFVSKELLFEREDTKQAANVAADGPDSSFAPGPDLGRHQIDHRDASKEQAAGDAKMKVGRIREDSQIGLLTVGLGQQFAVFAIDSRDVGDDFEQADHCQAGGVDDGAHAGLAEARTGAAEELSIGVHAPELFDDQGSVEVARGFARRNQDFPVHVTQV